jgi:asparagine synthase (glutamine-hydrolysing)
MGIQRLSIIDLAGGSQPIFNEDGSVVVTYNGEIYNYSELRKKLENNGHKFYTESDTEVLVHLWEEYGENLPEHLRGMFAFAIFDRKKESLFLARDRLGIKPLYTARTSGGFCWGSEVNAILSAGVSRKVDPRAVYDYFALRYTPHPRTLFEEVRKVEPGTSVLVTDGGERVSRRRYWSLEGGQPDSSVTASEVSSQVRQLLERSVDRRLMADVPLGAFLSGGLDSSAIVGMMAERIDEPRTFSIGFQGDQYDESEEAEFLAEYFGTDHTTHVVDLSSMDLFGDLVRRYGDPLADPAVLPTMVLSERASEDVKIALTGEGSDELFNGYSFYQNIDSVRNRVDWVPDIGFSLFENVAEHAPVAKPYFEFVSSLRNDEAYLTGQLRSYRRRPERFLDSNAGAGDQDIRNAVREAFNHANEDRLQRLSAFTLGYPLPNKLLYKVDHASMMYSLEARVPFLDYELVEFAHQIPARHKRTSGYKPILNRAVSDLLPKRTRRRSKQGFNVPLDRWFREDHEAINRWMNEELVDATPYLQPAYVFDEWERHQKGDVSVGGFLWTCLTYIAWFHEIAQS